jgi:glycosyltransferase involved in cell wall biosynthesis
MSESPCVSVVIPTYNHRQYVVAALESVFTQSFLDLEVIVVNDGSADDTEQVLKNSRVWGRLRYISQPNAGQGAARNRGIEAARGRYIALLDDDDLWPPDRLQWQVEVLESSPEVVLVYGDHLSLMPDGSLCPSDEPARPSGHIYDSLRERCWILSPGQTLIRRSAIDQVGGLDPSLWGADDWDLYLRLATVGPFSYRPHVALHYRWHEANASRNVLRHVSNHFSVVRRHIGWNLRLLLRQQHLSGRYFLPRLLHYAHQARCREQHRSAVLAYLWAMSFRPSLLWDRSCLAGLCGALLRRAPTAPGSGVQGRVNHA